MQRYVIILFIIFNTSPITLSLCESHYTWRRFSKVWYRNLILGSQLPTIKLIVFIFILFYLVFVFVCINTLFVSLLFCHRQDRVRDLHFWLIWLHFEMIIQSSSSIFHSLVYVSIFAFSVISSSCFHSIDYSLFLQSNLQFNTFARNPKSYLLY